MKKDSTYQGRAVRFALCLWLLAVGLVWPLVSCADTEPRMRLFTFQEPHMGTLFTIRVWAEEEEAAVVKKAVEEAFARIGALDRCLSHYRQDSELNQLADAPVGEPVKASDDLFFLLEKNAWLAEATGGLFDVTSGPLIRLWNQSRKEGRLPTEEQIARARQRVGYQHLVLDAAARTVTKRAEGMRLDSGAIGKGYASDEALKILKQAGFPRALVAGSGDIVVGDAPPGQPGWRVGIETLVLGTEAEDMQTVVLSNAAISTSGDSRKFVEIDGVRYSHIVSTHTGLGLAERIGATVIAPDGVTSDSFSTAISLLGEKDGLQFIKNQRGVECQIVTLRDGREVHVRSDGFNRFQNSQE